MASSIECSICMEEYDDSSRRPKVLACGHSLCTPCLDNCILRNMKKCCVCRTTFVASCVKDIAINTDLEKLIQLVSQVSVNGSQTGKCIPKEVVKNMGRVDSAIAALGKVVSDKNGGIGRKEVQVHNLLKEIDDDIKVRDEAMDCIKESQRMKSEIQDSITNTSTDNLELESKVQTLKEFLKHIEEKYDLVVSTKLTMEPNPAPAHKDPSQLNLLYVLCRDEILNLIHPITVKKSIEFAGIQCHVQFGDHIDKKHTSGIIQLKAFIPKEYLEIMDIENKMLVEYKKYRSKGELDAKTDYVMLAKSLITYGVRFFLVKEKMKGKTSLVSHLLGVTKDSVLRLDVKSKEIHTTWPLAIIRRRAVSPTTFTIDFGDYSKEYYVAQTSDGEQITQIIQVSLDALS